MRKRYAFKIVIYDRVSLDRAQSKVMPSIIKAWRDAKLDAAAKHIVVSYEMENMFDELAGSVRRRPAASRASIEPPSQAYLIEIIRLIA